MRHRFTPSIPGLFPLVLFFGCMAPETSVVVNEVMFDAEGAEPLREWIEVFNGGTKAQPLEGWVLVTGSDPLPTELPAWTLPAGAYLVIRFRDGSDDADFRDGVGTRFAGVRSDVFGDDADGIALYRCDPSPRCVVDYLAYDFAEAFVASPAHGHAVEAEIWTDSARFVDGLFAEAGNTLGRDARSIDTNRPEDWAGWGGLGATGATPGQANFGVLAYEVQGQAQPCQRPSDLTALEGEEFRGLVAEALEQIVRDHHDLFAGAPTQADLDQIQTAPNGDILIDNLRIRPGRRLNPEGHDALGLTCPPDDIDDTILIILDHEKIDSLWKMKSVLLHEIVHATHMRALRAGFWLRLSNGRVIDSRVREMVIRLHEVLSYLSNLKLLERLEEEFPGEADDIRTRASAKVRFMEHFLQQAIGDLRQLGNNPFYGPTVRQMLEGVREDVLRFKVWQARRNDRISRKERGDIIRVGRALGLSDDRIGEVLESEGPDDG